MPVNISSPYLVSRSHSVWHELRWFAGRACVGWYKDCSPCGEGVRVPHQGFYLAGMDWNHTKSSRARKYYSTVQRWMGWSIFLVRFACYRWVRVSIEQPCRRWHGQTVRANEIRASQDFKECFSTRTNPGEISETDIAVIITIVVAAWLKARSDAGVWWHLPRKSMIPKI